MKTDISKKKINKINNYTFTQSNIMNSTDDTLSEYMPEINHMIYINVIEAALMHWGVRTWSEYELFV